MTHPNAGPSRDPLGLDKWERFFRQRDFHTFPHSLSDFCTILPKFAETPESVTRSTSRGMNGTRDYYITYGDRNRGRHSARWFWHRVC